MEDRVLDQQMAQFLIYKQRHEEAAEIYLAEDDTLRAIDTLLDPECNTGAKRAHTLLTDEFWKRFPLHCAKEIPEGGHELMTLLDKAESKTDFTNLGGKEVCSDFIHPIFITEFISVVVSNFQIDSLF
jgi:hypothetical protein